MVGSQKTGSGIHRVSPLRYFTTHYARLSAHCIFSLILALAPCVANAGLIRDAEIENTLRLYTNPVLNAAAITPEDVRLFIVDDSSINAFVAGGLNIFIHTGLIKEAKTPGMLIGVIAHETGHIAGAHLSQLREKSTRATIGGIIGTVLGAAVVAAGGGQAGAGVILGSQSMAQRGFLSDIRINEQSADHAALSYLDQLGISATGMLAMFQTLHQKEMGTARDPFLTDHPLTNERIATMRNHIAESDIPPDAVPTEFITLHGRMLAKLMAFTEPYERVMRAYPANDTTLPARYAHAIAEFKCNNMGAALTGINALIKTAPKDPYFYDTKGQILFEHGQLGEAANAYAKASLYAPTSALILTDYAKTLIAQEKPAELPRAIALLERARELDDSYEVTWRQLAIAYGKQGKLGPSYAALAEEAALAGDAKTVLQHVARARQEQHIDSALALQLDDLERNAKAQLAKKRDTGLF